MDLYLYKDDFTEVYKAIRDQFNMAPEYDGGTLFAYKYGMLKKGQMEFGLGEYDTALFYHHHPFDSDDYNSFSVRSLYEEMLLFKKDRIPQGDIIYKEFKNGEVAINIGKMVERRYQRNEGIRLQEFEKNRLQSHAQKISRNAEGGNEMKQSIKSKHPNISPKSRFHKMKRRPKL